MATSDRFNYRISKISFICDMHMRRAFATELNQYISCRPYTADVFKYLDVVDADGYKIVSIADQTDKINYLVLEQTFKPLYSCIRDGFNLRSCGRGIYTITTVKNQQAKLIIFTPRGIYEYRLPQELNILSLYSCALSDNELLMTSVYDFAFYLFVVNLETKESIIQKYAAYGFHYNVISLADKILFGWYMCPDYLVFDPKTYEVSRGRTDTDVLTEFTRLKVRLNMDFVGINPHTEIVIGNGYGVHTFGYSDRLYYSFTRKEVLGCQIGTQLLLAHPVL